jgi:hypothetical protein
MTFPTVRRLRPVSSARFSWLHLTLPVALSVRRTAHIRTNFSELVS